MLEPNKIKQPDPNLDTDDIEYLSQINSREKKPIQPKPVQVPIHDDWEVVQEQEGMEEPPEDEEEPEETEAVVQPR